MEKLENSDLTDQNEDPPLNFKPFPFCVGSRQMALLPKTYTHPIIFFHIFVKTIIMKDYNSIPFKNSAIDRFTGNTTIVPGTQLKEVKVTPANITYDQSGNPMKLAHPKVATISQRDQSNDKLVDSRPYKETPAYKADKAKAAKKPKLNQEDRLFAGVMGGLVGTAGYSLLSQMNSKSDRKARRDNKE